MHSVEVFTGAGGLAIATHQAKFKHRLLAEWNRNACATLRANIQSAAVRGVESWHLQEGDVCEVDYSALEDTDLVAGGPPCQPFSIGGNHKGKDDDRDMIPQFIRAVRVLEPKAFIMENVRGLTRASFSEYFEYCILQMTHPTVTRQGKETVEQHLSRLEDAHTGGRRRKLKYNVVWRVLDAANYGVPQNRHRVFVVGIRSDLDRKWHLPAPTHDREALLFEQWVSGDYWGRHGLKQPSAPPVRWAKSVSKIGRSVPGRKPWRTIRDATCDLPAPFKDRASGRGVFDHRFQPGARAYPGHTGSPIDWPSKALKAGDHGVPGGENTILYPNGRLRYLSVREAARVQTFPDAWRFSGPWSEAMRQVGNAVPVQLAQKVAQSVASIIA